MRAESRDLGPPLSGPKQIYMTTTARVLFSLFALVIIVESPLPAQPTPKAAYKAFKASRKEHAGALRLLAVEELGRLQLPENVGWFMDALARNASAIRKCRS